MLVADDLAVVHNRECSHGIEAVKVSPDQPSINHGCLIAYSTAVQSGSLVTLISHFFVSFRRPSFATKFVIIL